MTWTPGTITVAANFQNNTTGPLDAKQTVEANVDLNDIDSPYDGLVVYVEATEKLHVCIDESSAGSGVSGAGVIDETVWKEVGSDSSVNAYTSIVAGGNTLVADSEDTLNFAEGSNIDITSNVSSDTLTIAATGLALSTHDHSTSDITDIDTAQVQAGHILVYDADAGETSWRNQLMYGDVTMTQAGVTTIGTGKVDNAMLAGGITDGKLDSDYAADDHNHDTAYAAKASGSTAANEINCTDNESTDENCNVVFVDGATGARGAETDGDLTYNPSTGKLTSPKFVGDGSLLTGLSGTGDVVGPNGGVDDGNIVLFNSTTGKIIKDSDKGIGDFATDDHNHTLNSLTEPNGSVNLSNENIINLAAPTADHHASTKAYTDTQIANLIDNSPAVLNTLNELAESLDDDADFAGTMTTALAGKSGTGHDHDTAYAAKASGSTAANEINCTDNESTNENCNVVFVDGATGARGAETDGDLTYNPSTGKLTSTKFVGDGSLLTSVPVATHTHPASAVEATTGDNDKVLTVSGGTAAWATSSSGSTFASLSDTPSSLSGQGGKTVAVNSGGNALEFVTGGGGGNLDTKGDLEVYTTEQTNLSVGANGYLLTADSTEPSGLKWAAAGSGTTFLGLTDTPSTFNANKTVAVNSAGDGLEFVTGGGGGDSLWDESGTNTLVQETIADDVGVGVTAADIDDEAKLTVSTKGISLKTLTYEETSPAPTEGYVKVFGQRGFDAENEYAHASYRFNNDFDDFNGSLDGEALFSAAAPGFVSSSPTPEFTQGHCLDLETNYGSTHGNTRGFWAEDPDLGTGDWCIEMSIYPTAMHDRYLIRSGYPESTWTFGLWDVNGLGIRMFPNGIVTSLMGNDSYSWSTAVNDSSLGDDKFTLNAWNHIAFTKNSGTINMWLNGNRHPGEQTGHTNNVNGTSGHGWGLMASKGRMYIQNYAIHKGRFIYDRLNATYTVPTVVTPTPFRTEVYGINGAGTKVPLTNYPASGLAGTLQLDKGGTGAKNQQDALDAITGSGTDEHVLTLTDGNAGWAPGVVTPWSDSGSATLVQTTITDDVGVGVSSIEVDTNAKMTVGEKGISVKSLNYDASNPSGRSGYTKVFSKQVYDSVGEYADHCHRFDNSFEDVNGGLDGSALYSSYPPGFVSSNPTPALGQSYCLDLETNYTAQGTSTRGVLWDDPELGTGDWCIELFLWPVVANQITYYLARTMGPDSSSSGWSAYNGINWTLSNSEVVTHNMGNDYFTFTGAIDDSSFGDNKFTKGAWNHLALTKNSNTINLWFNGIKHPVEDTNHTNSCTPQGGQDMGIFAQRMRGYVMNYTVTKGDYVYDRANSTYTVPTVPTPKPYLDQIHAVADGVSIESSSVSIGGNDKDANVMMTLHGAQSFKSQSSNPTGTSGYARVFSKGVDTIAAETDIKFHFDNSTNDSAAGLDIVFPGTEDPTFDDSEGNFKFGTHSLKFIDDGGANGGSLAIIPPSDQLRIYTNDFAMDWWMKIADTVGGTDGTGAITVLNGDCSSGTYGANTSNQNPGLKLVYYQHAHSTYPGRWALYVTNNTSNGGSYTYVYIEDPKTAAELQAWNHFALVRGSDNKVRFFINGVHEGTTSTAGGGKIFAQNSGNQGLALGRLSTLEYEYDDDRHSGDIWIDSFRLSNGSDRGWGNSTNSFTVPGSGLVTQLFHQDGTGVATQMTPHNAKGEWAFDSYDPNTQIRTMINTEEALRDLEALTGKTYIKKIRE